jgi:hypothetical protein
MIFVNIVVLVLKFEMKVDCSFNYSEEKEKYWPVGI